jgi:hypothetical protein
MNIKILSFALVLVLINILHAQKDMLGVSLINERSGINFINSEGEQLKYDARSQNGWGFNYGHAQKNLLVELGVNFNRSECSFQKPGLNTQISMDVINTSLSFSYLILKGPIRIKMGAHGGSLHVLSAHQNTNGSLNNLIKENIYKSTGFAAGGQAGLIFQSGEKNQIHITYYYNSGITSLENKRSQTSNLNSNGIQATVYLGL